MAIKIDIEDLASHMSMNSGDISSYLDLETGNIILFTSDKDFDEEEAEEGNFGITKSFVEENEKRFLGIQCFYSSDCYSWMEEFAEEQTVHVASKLLRAIEGQKPFRKFKDALDYLPDGITDAWHKFRHDREQAAAVRWLKLNDVEFEDCSKS